MSPPLPNKLRAGVVGATGMVGQRFVDLLADHPLFEISVVAASKRSAGKTYADVLEERESWIFDHPVPAHVGSLIVQDAEDVDAVAALCDFVFCAVDLDKASVLKLEYRYAKAETPVVSNNSAARGVADVPMLIPEVNAAHCDVIEQQRKRLGTTRGFIAVKPNCSIQSYVPPLTPLLKFGLDKVIVCTYQAISGAGKTFKTWPEMVDNIIPLIGGEEAKSETEPLKVWGAIDETKGEIVNQTTPMISAQCVRVPASDGHLAAVHIKFTDSAEKPKPTMEQIKQCWAEYKGESADLDLPSAPQPPVQYMDAPDRPQTRLDRDLGNGMTVSVGRLREDNVFDFKFVCLSHNTLRGAAGGAVLSAELLVRKGHLVAKDNSATATAAVAAADSEGSAKKARTE